MAECKADIYYRDKLAGLSIADIARKHGVSHQAVSQAISNKYGKHGTPRFREWTEEKCIYGNLRKWLNDREIGVTQFASLYYGDDYSRSSGYASTIYDWLSGKRDPHKKSIDRLLEVTGMTYEVLFSIEETSETAVNEDLISRSAVLGELADIMREMPVPEELYEDGIYSGLDSAFSLIEKAPAVEAEPVIHACWEKHSFVQDMYYCSNCHTQAPISQLTGKMYKSNGCPYCRAKMDKETAE